MEINKFSLVQDKFQDFEMHKYALCSMQLLFLGRLLYEYILW